MEILINNYIRKLYSCKNLFELSDCLQKLLTDTQSIPNRNKVLHEIYINISLNDLYKTKQHYYIYNDNESAIYYLMHYWTLKKTYKENSECLFNIINTIKEEMIASQKIRISVETTHLLMEAVENRFSFCSKVLDSNPIDILFIEHSHTTWDGIYSSILINDCKIRDQIIIPYLRYEVDFPQEFVFLHELGHALHTRITKKLDILPDSFNMIINKMFVTIQHEPNDQKAELFADCFAIAVLAGSDLKKYNPYTFVRNEDCLILIAYMMDLINKSFSIIQYA